MTIARIGDKIYDTTLHMCGCGLTTIQCEIIMADDETRCCWCCDHAHSLHTLKLYGLLER